MPQLHVSNISPELLKALKDWASAHGITKTAAVRLILSERLASQNDDQPKEIQR